MDKCDQMELDNDVIETTPEPDSEPRYPKRIRKPRTDLHTAYINSVAKQPKQKRQKNDDDDSFYKMDAWYSWYKWSDCKVAKRYDRERNFYPQPGPSTLNYYEHETLTGYYRSVGKSKFAKKSTARQNSDRLTKRANHTPTEVRAKVPKTRNNSFLRNSPLSPTHSDDSDWENDIRIQSFYEQNAKTRNSPDYDISPISNTSGCNEPVDKNVTLSTPVMSRLLEDLKKSPNDEKFERPKRNATEQYRIRPIEDAPSHCDIKHLLDSYQLPKVEHSVPHYSDPNDVIVNNSKKDVGNTVLQLSGRALNDCDEFISNFSAVGMSKWQKAIAKQASRGSQTTRDARVFENTNVVRTLLAGRREKTIRIKPVGMSPDHSQVNQWLKWRTETTRKTRASGQQREINDVESNGIKHQLNGLLSNRELTVTRITRFGKEKLIKLESQNKKDVHIVNDSDDDVICLDDELPMKNAELVGFPK